MMMFGEKNSNSSHIPDETKPAYEAPIIMPLGELARGQGQGCAPGSSPVSCGSGGSNVGGTCGGGSSNIGVLCNQGGSNQTGTCDNGNGNAGGICGNGNGNVGSTCSNGASN